MKPVIWTKQMDQTLLELAAKYPRGSNAIFWSKVLRDPLWKWGNVENHIIKHRHALLLKTSNPSTTNHTPKPRIPTPRNEIVPCGPQLNFCPHCGGNLSAFNAAIQINSILNGATDAQH